MSDPFLAEIRMFGFNFAPQGWASCDGQLLPISQNNALFALLGTTYGGDGRTTFALPNLQERLPLGTGQGPGLTDRQLGETGGVAAVSLSVQEMPAHQHALAGTSSPSGNSPAGALLSPTASGALAYRTPGATTAMAGGAIAVAGGGQPHENRPPMLSLTFCIAMQGIFPPRP